MKGVYYNEWNPAAADWLRRLIALGELPEGDVDERSITEVSPDDLIGYSQVHFFAGIGGWAYALRLAEWPEDQAVWTGSCPCQPFSNAGQRKGTRDARHLWPHFRRIVAGAKRSPPVVFGEQVASKDGRAWLAGIRVDLEALGYAVGAADLCAAGVGAPHIRQRLYWVADSDDAGCEGRNFSGQQRCRERASWANCVAIRGRDGRQRRVEPGSLPLVDGIPRDLGEGLPRLQRNLIRQARSYRGIALEGYGNAIVPELAAEFIRAFRGT